MSKLLIKKIVFLVQSWGGNSNRDEGGGDSEDAAGRYPEEAAGRYPEEAVGRYPHETPQGGSARDGDVSMTECSADSGFGCSDADADAVWAKQADDILSDSTLQKELRDMAAAATTTIPPEAKKLLEQAVIVIQEQSKELTETKVVAKQVIESLVAQNRLFLNTIADLQNTIKGLKWKLQQMSQSTKQTEALLKECSGTIGKLNQSLAGKDRAHSHRRAAGAALDKGLGGGAEKGFEKGKGAGEVRKTHAAQQAKSKSVKLAVSEILLGSCGSDSKAVDIVRGILNHTKLRAALNNELTIQDGSSSTNVDSDIVTELIASIDRLKKGARGSSE